MHPERRAALDALTAGRQPDSWMWGDLLADTRLAFPWPYTAGEMEELIAGFREEDRNRGANEIVAIARRCLAARRAKADLPRTAHPAREVASLANALDALEACLRNLSPETEQLLWDGVALVNADAASPTTLLVAISEFRSSNANLTRNVETKPSGGRPPELLRGWVLENLKRIFDECQQRTTRGRPAYLKRSLGPLGFSAGDPATMRRTLERSIKKPRPNARQKPGFST